MATSQRPLRIAHLAFSSLPRTVGGLEIVVDSLLRAQAEAGCHVSLVTRWKHYRAFRKADFPYGALALPPNPKLGDDPLGSVGPRWPVSTAVRAHQRRHRFDIWHVHSLYPAGWMAYDALAAMGVPVVLTAHGVDIETDCASGHGYRLRAKHDRRIRELVRRAACLTATSPSIEAAYREMGVPAERIRCIPNGVDLARFRALRVDRAAVRKAFGLPVDTTLVLTVGRNRPAKGHRFIPPALAALRRDSRNVAWVIFGGEPEAMLELARAEGVADHLFVLPPKTGGDASANRYPSDELIGLYKAADVFALPSVSEGFGLVVIEAMAAGLPVVASNVGALPHIIDDGRNGLLCEPAAPESLAAGIGRLLDEQCLGDRLAAAACQSVERYDWGRISASYLDLYSELIEAAARS